MIDLKDVLLTPVAAGLLSQPILRDSAAAVAAHSRRNVRMPGVVQVDVGQSSAGIRRQARAAALNAGDVNAIDDERTHLRAGEPCMHCGQCGADSFHLEGANETDSQQQTCAPDCDSQQHICSI